MAGCGRPLRSWTHVRLDRRNPSYCRVTFDHPPINTITATTVAELAELVGLIESDPDLNVVVFDSAGPDFYLAHYDTEHDPRRTAALGTGPTGMHAWLDVLVRLSRAPVISLASIRGRARGAGSEFVLACDLRFASRENTLLGQFEVGIGVVPVAVRWPGSPAWPVAAARSRCSSSRTISTDAGRNSTGTSTAPSPTTSSTTRSVRSPRDSRASTMTRWRARSPMSTR
jgi:enoyl-CoA hydratase/carnithine racemase